MANLQKNKIKRKAASHPHTQCMNKLQIKEETNESECYDISRTIQRNVSNNLILVAVLLVF